MLYELAPLHTGSGKSSLIVALWRLVEPAGGSVFLDGVNLASIELAQLRNAITCIPQDPVLFSGTVRFNLDPFREHGDERIWYGRGGKRIYAIHVIRWRIDSQEHEGF